MRTQGRQFVKRGAEIFFCKAFLHAQSYIIKMRKKIYFRLIGKQVNIKLTSVEILQNVIHTFKSYGNGFEIRIFVETPAVL